MRPRNASTVGARIVRGNRAGVLFRRPNRRISQGEMEMTQPAIFARERAPSSDAGNERRRTACKQAALRRRAAAAKIPLAEHARLLSIKNNKRRLIRAALRRIEAQAIDHHESRLMLGVVAQAALDLLLPSQSAAAERYLREPLHAAICGIDPEWVTETFVKMGIIEGD